MTSTGSYGPPPGSGPEAPGGQPASGGSSASAVWWVVAGIAVVVIVGLVAWLVLAGSPQAGPSSTPQTTPVSSPASTAPVSQSPVEPSPSTPGSDEWGEFPPNHLDSAKDLSDPQFPERVSTYDFESEDGDSNSVIAVYRDSEHFASFSVSVKFAGYSYSQSVARMTDVGYFESAVCGRPAEFPDQIKCFMMGTTQLLSVGTASDLTVETVAALTEEVYDAL